jgi:hypothetical protein
VLKSCGHAGAALRFEDQNDAERCGGRVMKFLLVEIE